MSQAQDPSSQLRCGTTASSWDPRSRFVCRIAAQTQDLVSVFGYRTMPGTPSPSPAPNQTTEPNASRSASQELHGDRQRVARAELESLVTWTRTHCGAGCSPYKGFRGAGRARGAVTACRSGSVAGARCRCRILWVIKSPPAPRGEIAALGDSDKAAGEIPSEMQKRCAGRRCR